MRLPEDFSGPLGRGATRSASAWAAAERYGIEPAKGDSPGGVNPLAITYLNRLSDLLFILTRVVNGPNGDMLWVPGGERRDRERQ